MSSEMSDIYDRLREADGETLKLRGDFKVIIKELENIKSLIIEHKKDSVSKLGHDQLAKRVEDLEINLKAHTDSHSTKNYRYISWAVLVIIGGLLNHFISKL